VEDNTDQFSSSALEGALNTMLPAYNAPPVPPRVTADATLAVVEIYPYVPYIQFLLPGTIVLAIFVSAMIGGGIIFILTTRRAACTKAISSRPSANLN
jgi:ABC-2 type transport system permease protein